MTKAVFLDRDGVLNHDFGYTFQIKDLQVLPGVPKALSALDEAGYALIVVTNQSGIGRELCTEEDVLAFNQALAIRINRMGGPLIKGFLFCPHAPEAFCLCRKPSPQLIEDAVEKLDIDVKASWMIGDQNTDIQAGKAAGCQTVQVMTDTFPSLTEATEYILNNESNDDL